MIASPKAIAWSTISMILTSVSTDTIWTSCMEVLNKVPFASNNLGETGTINRYRFWYAHVTDVTILFYHVSGILRVLIRRWFFTVIWYVLGIWKDHRNGLCCSITFCSQLQFCLCCLWCFHQHQLLPAYRRDHCFRHRQLSLSMCSLHHPER